MATYLVFVPKSAPGRSASGVNSVIISNVADEPAALTAARAVADAMPIPGGARIDLDAGWRAVQIGAGDLSVPDFPIEGDVVSLLTGNTQRGS